MDNKCSIKLFVIKNIYKRALLGTAIFLSIVILIMFLSVLLIKPFYKGKDVHFSIDDVIICIKDLNDNQSNYSSLFEQPFFSDLKKCHELFGAKFTLYIYENYNGFKLSDLTNKYRDEFVQNSDWLKIGYHAKSPSITRDSISNTQVLILSYANAKKWIDYSIGSNASSLRLHYYYATQEEVDSMKKMGVLSLLSADDERISYSLPKRLNDMLISNEELNYNGMHYEHTDIRVESIINPLYALWQNRNDNTLVVFTHEWAFRNPTNKVKYILFLWLFCFYECNYIVL